MKTKTDSKKWQSVHTIFKQETLLPQTDRAMRYVSQSIVACRNELYYKSTTNRSDGVRGLQLTDL